MPIYPSDYASPFTLPSVVASVAGTTDLPRSLPLIYIYYYTSLSSRGKQFIRFLQITLFYSCALFGTFEQLDRGGRSSKMITHASGCLDYLSLFSLLAATTLLVVIITLLIVIVPIFAWRFAGYYCLGRFHPLQRVSYSFFDTRADTSYILLLRRSLVSILLGTCVSNRYIQTDSFYSILLLSGI